MTADNSRPSQSVLIIGACGLRGREVTLSLASEGARILIPYHEQHEEVLRLSAEAASRGAAVLPLMVQLPPYDEEDWNGLLARQVEDFGRLDAVVFILPPGHADEDRDAEPGLRIEAIRSCARAAGPVLRPVRPAGHFLIICAGGGASDDEGRADSLVDRIKGLELLAKEMAAEWGAKKSRACINLLVVAGEVGISESAEYAKGLLMERGRSGEVIHWGQVF